MEGTMGRVTSEFKSTFKSTLGFTLIELVIVITLLGILAATALPKFVNLTTQARVAANQGVAGGFAAATSIAHAGWLAQGSTSPVTMENTSVVMSANGWPVGTGADSTSTTMTNAKCLNLWNGILNNPPIAAVGTCTGTCQYLATPTGTTCVYQDQQGTQATAGLGNQFIYDSSIGAITIGTYP